MNELALWLCAGAAGVVFVAMCAALVGESHRRRRSAAQEIAWMLAAASIAAAAAAPSIRHAVRPAPLHATQPSAVEQPKYIPKARAGP